MMIPCRTQSADKIWLKSSQNWNLKRRCKWTVFFGELPLKDFIFNFSGPVQRSATDFFLPVAGPTELQSSKQSSSEYGLGPVDSV